MPTTYRIEIGAVGTSHARANTDTLGVLDSASGAIGVLTSATLTDLIGARDTALEVPTGTLVTAGSDIQAALNAAATGATIVLGAGIHRRAVGATALAPKQGQTIWGQTGAILTGGLVVADGSWTAGTGVWTATGQLPASYFDGVYNPCQGGGTLCSNDENVYRDDVHLTRVASAAAVVPGTVYMDYNTNTITVGDDPIGHVMEVSRVKQAINVNTGVTNVTIRNLQIEKFATTNQVGAVHLGGTGGVVRNCNIRFSHAAGVKIAANNCQVLNNHIHHNGALGIACYFNTGSLIDGNELDHNNTDGTQINDGECGGIKITTQTTVTVTNNYIHHNLGIGIWFDVEDNGSLCEFNTSIDNASCGIRYEISINGIVRNNTVRRCGWNRQQGDGGPFYGAGISLNTCGGVTCNNNVVEDCDYGIIARHGDRGSGAFGARLLQNVLVQNNTVKMLQGTTGLVVDSGDTSFYTSRNNQFLGNDYFLGNTTGSWFHWQNGTRTPTVWQNTYGNDTAASGGSMTDVFSPADLAGLVQWFEADRLGLRDGDLVSSWRDLSGGGRTMTQATRARCPKFVESEVTLNGQAAVDFDGDDYMTSALATTAVNNYTVCMVMSSDDLSMGYNVPYHNGNGVANGWGLAFLVEATGLIGWLRGGIAWHTTTTAATTGPVILTLQRLGGVTTIYRNGIALSPTFTEAPTTPTLQSNLGAHRFDGIAEYFNGKIAAGVVCNSAPSLTALHAHFATKYGIT